MAIQGGKAAKKTAKKKPKKVLSPADKALKKLQSDHRNLIRSIFRSSGFSRISGISDRAFNFDNQECDIDDIFVYENIVVLAEYTTSQSSGVGPHLKNKKVLFDKILANEQLLVSTIKQKFPDTISQLPSLYHDSSVIVKIIYCSRYDFDDHYKSNVPGPEYMGYPEARYFGAVSDAIKKSSRFELLHFLKIDPNFVGEGGKVKVSKGSSDYAGSILPEAHSGFAKGFKVVSFYADPEALLRTSYVLRKDGWRDSLNLYQRMISKSKVESIRNYLKKEKRVFLNNIIVTLPPEVKPLNAKSDTVDTATLKSTAPVTIKLPDRPNSIGIIDGQHRVFAYHEAVNDDTEIAQLRVQQNLLITGIIYPEGTNDATREQFEARLFLEINSTQTNAKAQLKQAIGLVLEPYSSESIATRVLSGLAKTGPLAGFVEQYFFDTQKLKTTSIVSYALKPLVKTSGADSLFAIWPNESKSLLVTAPTNELLQDYIKFCIATVNIGLSAFRRNLDTARWTSDPKAPGRVLATTYVNSFLISLRLLIGKGVKIEPDGLAKALIGINTFDFSKYHSSQYARMAEEIVQTYFP